MANPGLIVKIVDLATTLGDILSNMSNARTVSVGIENSADTDLVYRCDSFSSGRWQYEPPPSIPQGEAGAMGGEDKDGSAFTGVNGIVVYDAKNQGFSIICAFDNPFSGSYKTACGIASYGSFNASNLDEYMNKLSQDGSSAENAGYRVTASGGAPEEVFSVQKL